MSDCGDSNFHLLNRRDFLKTSATCILGAGSFLSRVDSARAQGETLYNGIRLPTAWPPPQPEITREPMSPPYLASPPEVIPIDVGRQLFVDDFLIAQTTLKRTFHAAQYYAGCPVLTPDRSWEQTGNHPTAMPFSDGVWYDPQDKLFKMWYMGGSGLATCYAASHDGLHWEKLDLDVQPETNIVLPQRRDSATVWLDLETHDPRQRYKLFRSAPMGERWGLYGYFSPDGIHWGEPVVNTGSVGDRSTLFWNPFRKVWVYSLRHGWGQPRRRRYFETRDLTGDPRWERIDEPIMWVGADRLDPPRPDLQIVPQLYNLDCVAYESLLLGLFSIWYGQRPEERPKPNQVCVGFSRDGFYWDRPAETRRQPLLPVSETRGTWNWGNVQSAGGCCLVVGDKLYLYCSGRTFVDKPDGSHDEVATTGLAFLRRDGFASLDADTTEGTLTTRPVAFTGRYPFVNVQAPQGRLQVEILDVHGHVIAPFSRARCKSIQTDSTLHAVQWKGVKDLSAFSGRPVRFRFHLTNGRLYAFWVSPDPKGASRGYVAAGGPGFTGPTDTAGKAARQG